MNQYHRSVLIQGHHHKVFSWEPWYLHNTNFTNDKFTALCKKTLNDWGTSKNIKMHVFSLAQAKFVKNICQQKLTQTFSPDSDEEFRREEPDFKAKENKV